MPQIQIKRPFLISIATIFLILTAYLSGILDKPEGWSYDQRMSISRDGSTIDEQVSVILIDDASLKAMDGIAGRWPWPRSIYADLLDFFSMGEPRAILFDITFLEKALTEQQGESINPHDQRLVDASSMYPFAYHAARFIVDTEDEINKDLLNQPLPQGFSEKFELVNRYRNFFGIDNLSLSLDAPSNNVFYLPFNELLEAAAGVGVVDMNSDNDGVYRTARLFHRYNDGIYPALSTTAIIDTKMPNRILHKGQQIIFGENTIPVDENEKYWVKYYDQYNSYSFSGIIASLFQIQEGNLENLMVDPSIFKDKYVFIGASAAGLEDLKNSPMDARLPGVMIHASIASNILNNDYLVPPNKTITIIAIIILAFFTSFVSLVPKRAWLKNIIPPVLLSSYILAAYLAFKNGYVLELAAPTATIMLAWSVAFSFLVFTEGKEKRRFKRMMSQYLSPAVLETVVSNHEEFAKAEVGSKENISMLFSDIRSFTNLSEKLAPEKVVEMLNHYFSSMTDSIFHYEGTIDKFIGDAIMAFWGAPIKTTDHADKATLSALDMIYRLDVVNQWLADQEYPSIAIGVGIHTGDAILGNIGSENKLDYTIIGDNVNLASRIEGLTKTYHSKVLISEDTFHSLSLDIPCQLLDLVRVKGKQHPIKIYRPLAHPSLSTTEELTEARRVASLSEDAFVAYLARNWADAAAIWRQMPEDQATEDLLERCDIYAKTPPNDDWDGAFTMTSK